MLIYIVFLCLSLLMTVSMTGCSDDLIYSKNFESIKTGCEINMYIAADLHHFSKSIYDDGEVFNAIGVLSLYSMTDRLQMTRNHY